MGGREDRVGGYRYVDEEIPPEPLVFAHAVLDVAAWIAHDPHAVAGVVARMVRVAVHPQADGVADEGPAIRREVRVQEIVPVADMDGFR